MKFIYTEHVEERIKQRKIKKEWIEEAIKYPDKLLGAKFGRKQSIKNVSENKISVIYNIENDNCIIITVYWGE